MTPEDELDTAQLRALLGVPGALKIVSGAHACGAGTHPDPSVPGAFDQARCDAFAYPRSDPRHWVLLDVVALEEEPGRPGEWRATAADGSYAQGTPGALLHHLARWRV